MTDTGPRVGDEAPGFTLPAADRSPNTLSTSRATSTKRFHYNRELLEQLETLA